MSLEKFTLKFKLRSKEPRMANTYLTRRRGTDPTVKLLVPYTVFRCCGTGAWADKQVNTAEKRFQTQTHVHREGYNRNDIFRISGEEWNTQ